MGLQVAEKMEEQPYNTQGKKFAAIVNRGLLASGWEIFSVFPLVWRIFLLHVQWHKWVSETDFQSRIAICGFWITLLLQYRLIIGSFILAVSLECYPISQLYSSPIASRNVNRNSGWRFCVKPPRFWVAEYWILVYTHRWELMKPVGGHGSSLSLLFHDGSDGFDALCATLIRLWQMHSLSWYLQILVVENSLQFRSHMSPHARGTRYASK